MKIKNNKQLNLPQLIEWAWDNDVRDKVFWTTKDNRGVSYEACFSEFGSFYSDDILDSNVIFTVEVEEEITEDTVIPRMLMLGRYDGWDEFSNHKLSDFNLNLLSAYMINDDLTMTLIWHDGKLVE